MKALKHFSLAVLHGFTFAVLLHLYKMMVLPNSEYDMNQLYLISCLISANGVLCAHHVMLMFDKQTPFQLKENHEHD